MKKFTTVIGVIAIAFEVIAILGIDLLIFSHYWENAKGLGVFSSVGVVLASLTACAALHTLITRYTALVKLSSFIVWFGLTITMALAGGSVWIAMSAQRDLDTRSQATNERVKAEGDAVNSNIQTLAQAAEGMTDKRAARELIRATGGKLKEKPAAAATIAGPKPKASVEEYFEQNSIFLWFYKSGIHYVPLVAGILGFAVWIAVMIAMRAQEEAAETQAEGEGRRPEKHPAGFAGPATATARTDKDPKAKTDWI